MAKRQKLLHACADEGSNGALVCRNEGVGNGKDTLCTAGHLAQLDQDVERRKFKHVGGLFEKVLMGQMTLQDAIARGLCMTAEQQRLYQQVRYPAVLQY